MSFSQQSFPRPKVADALAANQAIRRAKQHAFQAGYLISFTEKSMHDAYVTAWTPAFWRSYRLPRVVNPTLSAEAQAMVMATGMAEWALLLLSECLDGRTFLQSMWDTASKCKALVVTDCKSLFDHVQSQSAPTLDDCPRHHHTEREP